MSDITVIGSIIGEITAYPYDQLKLMVDQNSGDIEGFHGGTGRNIAENLGKMGADVAFAAVAGDDFIGRGAKSELDAASVNTEYVALLKDENTAMHISMINIAGGLEVAIGNGKIFDKLDQSMVEKFLDRLNASKAVVLDGTFSKETMQYLTDHVTAPLFFDPEMVGDAQKAIDVIGKFHTIMPNRAEASVMCGVEIFSEEQFREAGQWFLEQGVQRIFITMSGGGVYYKDSETEGILRPDAVKMKAHENGTGAAFSAAVVDGFVKGMDIEAQAKYGMAAAAVALETKASVHPEMSLEKIGDYNA